MNNKYTAVIKQDGDWWLGWIEEIPGINCQEATHEELIKSLKTTSQEACEDPNLNNLSFKLGNINEPATCQ